MKASYLIITIALLGVTAAAAKDEPQAQGPAAEKKICRTTGMTGSRLRTQTVCMTQAEWDQQRHDTKQDVDDMQRNRGAIAGQSGGMGSASGLAR